MIININHAFDGFLYSPLFLASELGFFPQCARLVYRDGDSQCLDALCGHSEANERNWFAICDPFSLDISTKVPEQTDDNICVVGCLIDRLPVWVYNTDNLIVPVTKEEHLKQYNNKIKRLICYRQGTTGYLIGKRLQQHCFQDSNLETMDFGSEFGATLNHDTAVATSDVLQIVHNGLNSKKIIFNYPMRSPAGLNPFLFTGILTLEKKVVDENLWAVLTVLAGIKHATDLLRQPIPDPECVPILTRRFEPQLAKMGVTGSGAEHLIKQAIAYAFQTENIYSESLKPVKKAWDNAKLEWETTTGRKFADTEERDQPIPSLLIRRGWRRDDEFRRRVNEGFADPITILKNEELGWGQKLSPLGAGLLTLLSLFALLSHCVHAHAKLLGDDLPGVAFAVIAFLIQTYFTIRMFRHLLKSDTTTYGVDWTCVLGFGLGVLVSALGLIK